MFLVDTIFVIRRRFSQKEIRENIDGYHYLLENNLELKNLIRNESKLITASIKEKFAKNDIFSFVPARVFNRKIIGHGRLELEATNEVHNFQKPGAGSVYKIAKNLIMKRV